MTIAGRTDQRFDIPWDLIDRALTEDIGGGDITSLVTVPAETTAHATFVAKAEGVLSGVRLALAVLTRVDSSIQTDLLLGDGSAVTPGTVFATVDGNARGILTGERVALNFVQRLSGVATLTRQFVDAVAGTGATIVDTRKTTPGLRGLEKAAVRDGGGRNHRFGLSDGVLIKDNHLAAVGGADRLTQAVARARAQAPHPLKVEVEVTTLSEVVEAVAAGAEIILLDNMSVAEMGEAVRLVDGRALLEASGGVNLSTVRAIAETGVNLISVGALTHSAPALDISLEFRIE